MKYSFSHDILINAPPESVYSFFERISSNYTRWHPDHLNFRWITGDHLAQGNSACVDHVLNGKPFSFPLFFSDIVPGSRIEFSWGLADDRFFSPSNLWLFEPAGNGCRFVSHSSIALSDDLSGSQKAERGLALLKSHLAQEGENLKQLVEADKAQR